MADMVAIPEERFIALLATEKEVATLRHRLSWRQRYECPKEGQKVWVQTNDGLVTLATFSFEGTFFLRGHFYRYPKPEHGEDRFEDGEVRSWLEAIEPPPLREDPS